MPNDRMFLTQKHLTERYQISVQTLWRWRRDGKIPPGVGAGRRVTWDRNMIEEWERRSFPTVDEWVKALQDEAKSLQAELAPIFEQMRDRLPGGVGSITMTEEDRRVFVPIRNTLRLIDVKLYQITGGKMGSPSMSFEVCRGDDYWMMRVGEEIVRTQLPAGGMTT